MKKRLMMALAAAALVVAMVPGVTSAKGAPLNDNNCVGFIFSTAPPGIGAEVAIEATSGGFGFISTLATNCDIL